MTLAEHRRPASMPGAAAVWSGGPRIPLERRWPPGPIWQLPGLDHDTDDQRGDEGEHGCLHLFF
jgi:hypothetical protein